MYALIIVTQAYAPEISGQEHRRTHIGSNDIFQIVYPDTVFVPHKQQFTGFVPAPIYA
jgi:hypothetical protein